MSVDTFHSKKKKILQPGNIEVVSDRLYFRNEAATPPSGAKSLFW